ncbi:Deoxyuridine 5-triphosphate nucleotidohydrolase [Lasiodiplodia theobromae]|uniref:Deoxyuridine 5-triphosphate nucleotidohydrolase n=1 Tax=Lasiodiplodia theobromae TaxID=45133 RepID=UPI0015C2E8DB|nr:Deoxyuridine 5-triphosphate nucleotidohydrolase [Lasiodiplodia theobromae]KAF4537132.1 Deoxyuridine 5-triphosphate nucleotidohydrolase [Lasiodiplodia theobromae]
MSESNNDPSATPSLSHDPPSLPASPVGLLGVHLQLKMRHRKRTKHIDLEPPANATSALHHASTIAAGDESGTATPTPIAMSTTTAALAPAPESTTMQVQLLSENAKAPTKGSAFAAGHDLYSSADTVIPARKWALVPTDIKISVPAGTYGRVAPRSGLAFKHGIDTLAGVIDADYRGPVGVLLANLSDVDFEVKKHDRIAQLVIEKCVMADVAVVEKLEDTVRGAGGFGSTGGFGAEKNGA